MYEAAWDRAPRSLQSDLLPDTAVRDHGNTAGAKYGGGNDSAKSSLWDRRRCAVFSDHMRDVDARAKTLQQCKLIKQNVTAHFDQNKRADRKRINNK